jgi:hypothetical protein
MVAKKSDFPESQLQGNQHYFLVTKRFTNPQHHITLEQDLRMPVLIENITIIHILEHMWIETAGYRTERTTISTTQRNNILENKVLQT